MSQGRFVSKLGFAETEYSKFRKGRYKCWRSSTKRRAHLKALIAGVFALKLGKGQTTAKSKPPIHLFVEMEADRKNEREMLSNFHEYLFPKLESTPDSFLGKCSSSAR